MRRHLRHRTAHALGLVAHVFQAVDALDDPRLVVRLHHIARLLQLARNTLDTVAHFRRRILRRHAGLLGFAEGLLQVAVALLDFVCLQHDDLLWKESG